MYGTYLWGPMRRTVIRTRSGGHGYILTRPDEELDPVMVASFATMIELAAGGDAGYVIEEYLVDQQTEPDDPPSDTEGSSDAAD